MGFFSGFNAGNLLSLAGNIGSSLLGRSKGSKRVTLSQLVAEAKAAGLHPLAALGATPVYEQPQEVGHTADVASALAQFGQDVNRSASAQMTPEDRILFNLKVKQAELQNQILGQDLEEGKRRLQGMTPVSPTGGSVNGGDIIEKVDRQPVQVVNPTAQTAGNTIPVNSFAYDGNFAFPIPSEELAESMEGSFQGMPIDIQMGITRLYTRAATIFGADKAFQYFQDNAPPRTADMKRNNRIWLWDGLSGAYEKSQLGSQRVQKVLKMYNYVIPARWSYKYTPHRPDNKH